MFLEHFLEQSRSKKLFPRISHRNSFFKDVVSLFLWERARVFEFFLSPL